MQAFTRITKRLYYENMYLQSAKAKIVQIGADYIELDATVAYPEGGGQEADTGIIITGAGNEFRFIGAKRLFGRMLFLADFPGISVEGIIRHLICPEDVSRLDALKPGDDVEIHLDTERRASLTLSHTASHLLYVGVATVRPDAVQWVRGCHIKPGSARFDFSVKERFTSDQISEIGKVANQLVSRASPIKLYSHATELHARYWQCEDYVIPCGGTHLDNTKCVGPLILRRKGLGRGLERIACEFPDAQIDTSKFHQ